MRNIPVAILLGLAITACGPQSNNDDLDRLVEIDNVEVDNDNTNPVEQEDENLTEEDVNEEDWEEWDDEWEEWGNEEALNVQAVAMSGQVGQHLFNEGEARGSGYRYTDDGYEFTSIDSRADLGEDTVMVLLNIDGDLRSDILKDGATFSWDSWGDGAVYVDVIGCAGTEDMWEDYDAPADEVEVTVTEDPENPDVVTVEYVASWESWETGEILQAKGVTVLDLQ